MTADMVEAVAALLWPVMAFAAIAYLAPMIRERFRKGDISIRVGDFELTAQEANEQLRRQVEDLQEKVAALTAPQPGESKGFESFRPETRAESAPLRILWVDNQPQNNASLIEALRERGHSVTLARSTDEALGMIGQAGYDLILSDVGRPEGRRAGLDLLRALRGTGVTTPFGLFTTAGSAARHRDEALAMGAEFATASATELLAEIGRIMNRNR